MIEKNKNINKDEIFKRVCTGADSSIKTTNKVNDVVYGITNKNQVKPESCIEGKIDECNNDLKLA